MINYLWTKWILYQTNGNRFKRVFFNTIKFPINFYKFIKECVHVLMYGYPYMAVYDHDDYFRINTYSILADLLKCHTSHPEGCTAIEWDLILQQMLQYLDGMRRTKDSKFENILDNKNKFFELYSKYFYDLWD